MISLCLELLTLVLKCHRLFLEQNQGGSDFLPAPRTEFFSLPVEVREQPLLLFGELSFAKLELLRDGGRLAFVLGSLRCEALDGYAKRFGLLGDLHLARSPAVLSRIEIRFAFTKFGAALRLPW